MNITPRLFAIAALACALIATAATASDGTEPGASLPRDGDASEYWDLTITLDSGTRVFARFTITNEGPGRRTGVAIGHVIPAGGKPVKFRNGRMRKRWELSDDHLALDIGKSHLDLHGPRYRLHVRKDDVKVDLHFDPQPVMRMPAEATGSRDYEVVLLALGAACDGEVWLEGMDAPAAERGHATLVHTISHEAETDLALRRIEVTGQAGDQHLYATQLVNPRGRATSWLATRESAKDISGGPEKPQSRTMTSIRVEPGSETWPHTKGGSKSSYWIPHELSINGTEFQGIVRLEDPIVRHLPLDDLPGPIAMIARWSTKPSRVWSTAGIEVRISPNSGPGTPPLKGHGVVTISHLNPRKRRP